jgi:hypothetical protein
MRDFLIDETGTTAIEYGLIAAGEQSRHHANQTHYDQHIDQVS